MKQFVILFYLDFLEFLVIPEESSVKTRNEEYFSDKRYCTSSSRDQIIRL